MSPLNFVNAYAGYALDNDTVKNVPQLFTLSQAAIESGWGEHIIGGMIFGVKANKDTPPEKKELIVTTEYSMNPNLEFPEIISKVLTNNAEWKYTVKDWFLKFDSASECFEEHNKFLKTNERYAQCFDYSADPYKFAEMVCNCGYATNPSYFHTLSSVMKMIEPLLPSEQNLSTQNFELA